MRKAKNALSKAMVFIYIFFKACAAKLAKKCGDEVLIIEFGHFGDSLVDSGAILFIKQWYEKRGKTVSLLCAPETWKMLKLIPDLSQMNVLPFASYRFEYSLQSTRELLRNIGKRYSDVILLSPISAYYFLFTACVPGNKSANLYPEFFCGWRKIFLFLFRPFFKNIYISKTGQSRFHMVAQFLNVIGISGYRPQITYLPVQEARLEEEPPYISIIVDSSNPTRKWPVENVVQLIDWLLNHYDYRIYLLGATPDLPLASQLEGLPSEKKVRIKDLAGKTTVEEWIERIRRSEFIIGVDSGAIHVAASTGTPAFCLAGRWSIDSFVPYPPDVAHDGLTGPICIFRKGANDLPCRNCVGRMGQYGKTNKKCFDLCRQGKSCLCLQELTAEDVIKAICGESEKEY